MKNRLFFWGIDQKHFAARAGLSVKFVFGLHFFI